MKSKSKPQWDNITYLTECQKILMVILLNNTMKCGETGSHPLLARKVKWCSHSEKQFSIKHLITTWNSNFILSLFIPENENLPSLLQNSVQQYFMAALIAIAQDWRQQKYLSMDEWLKQIVVYQYGMLLSSKNEWTTDTHNNLDEFQGIVKETS